MVARPPLEADGRADDEAAADRSGSVGDAAADGEARLRGKGGAGKMGRRLPWRTGSVLVLLSGGEEDSKINRSGGLPLARPEKMWEVRAVC